MTSEDLDHFMDLALEEGSKGELEGNVPVGSVRQIDTEVRRRIEKDLGWLALDGDGD